MRAADDPTRYGDVTRMAYNSANGADMFRSLLGHKAQNKHLPPFFLRAPREFRNALFAGLMDTDGTVSVVKAKSKAKPQLQSSFCTTSFRLAREVKLLAASLGICGRVTPFKYRGDRDAWLVNFSSPDMQKWGCAGMACKRKVDNLFAVPVNAQSPISAASDVVPITKRLADQISRRLKPREDKQIWTLYCTGRKSVATGTMSRMAAERMLEIVKEVDPDCAAEFEAWKQIVANTNVYWDQVVGVQKTGVVQDGYDLTVPGYETFMAADGVILSNTMQYHVPVSDEARDEAIDRMLPSRNLLSPADFKSPMAKPGQEYVGGLYAASAMQSKRPPRTFRNSKDVMAAFLRGDLDIRDPVVVLSE